MFAAEIWGRSVECVEWHSSLKSLREKKKFRRGGELGVCGGRFQDEHSEREGKKSARKVWEAEYGNFF